MAMAEATGIVLDVTKNCCLFFYVERNIIASSSHHSGHAIKAPFAIWDDRYFDIPLHP